MAFSLIYRFADKRTQYVYTNKEEINNKLPIDNFFLKMQFFSTNKVYDSFLAIQFFVLRLEHFTKIL